MITEHVFVIFNAAYECAGSECEKSCPGRCRKGFYDCYCSVVDWVPQHSNMNSCENIVALAWLVHATWNKI